jgi:hypothetical protein
MVMVHFQIPLPGLARDFNDLTEQEREFIAYFSTIDLDCISPVVDCYAGIGPKGYPSADITIERIGDLANYDLTALLGGNEGRRAALRV